MALIYLTIKQAKIEMKEILTNKQTILTTRGILLESKVATHKTGTIPIVTLFIILHSVRMKLTATAIKSNNPMSKVNTKETNRIRILKIASRILEKKDKWKNLKKKIQKNKLI